MSHCYNEHDAYATQWLRNLIAAGHLPDGWVDERSIALELTRPGSAPNPPPAPSIAPPTDPKQIGEFV